MANEYCSELTAYSEWRCAVGSRSGLLSRLDLELEEGLTALRESSASCLKSFPVLFAFGSPHVAVGLEAS